MAQFLNFERKLVLRIMFFYKTYFSIIMIIMIIKKITKWNHIVTDSDTAMQLIGCV